MNPEAQGIVYVNPPSNGCRCLVCNTYFPNLLQVCPVCDISSVDAREILAEKSEK